ncbi:YibE/F family protein [Clostridiaceae bacterium M8S5]|nr:YibE/F family protein [Clostridiaceae bacterium M8S5]
MKSWIKNNILAIIVLCLIPIIIFFSPVTGNKKNIPKYFNQVFEKGVVVSVLEESLEPDEALSNRMNGKQVLKVKILSGTYKGNTYESTNLLSRSHNVLAKEGTKIVVGIRETEKGPQIWVYNYRRELTVYFIIGIFLILLIILGGMKGLKSAISLLFTGTIIIFILIPQLFSGRSAILTTIILMSISVIISFVLISDWNKKTLASILGTIGGIIIAGLISYTAGSMTHLSGINMREGEQLAYMVSGYGIDISGLMFSAILISSIGAVMDVAMSISSSISEIYLHNPSLSRKSLFISGMNVGKDIMGTMSNTLILAFAGGSLTTMMLMYGYQLQTIQFLNLQEVAIEMIQGFSGSIGIVLTVPLTAFIMTRFVSEK